MDHLTDTQLHQRLTSWRIFFEREADPALPAQLDPTPASVATCDGELALDPLLIEARGRTDATLAALAQRVELLAELYTDALDAADAAGTGCYAPTYPRAGQLH